MKVIIRRSYGGLEHPKENPELYKAKGGDGISALKTALGLSISALASEHVFSATLSSPWTTGKLAKTQGDKDAFWKLFTEAAVASFIFSGILGLILNDKYALLASIGSTAVITAWVGYDYQRALDGSLYQTSDPNAGGQGEVVP